MLKLFKVPGAYVFCFLGHFGSGKSLSLVEQGILCANQFRRSLCASFYLDEVACRRYAHFKGYTWFRDFGRIDGCLSARELLEKEDSILLLDEAGLEVYSRNFISGKNQKLIERLFKIRHYGNILFYAAQHFEQIDKQFRLNTQCWVYCKSFQPFSYKLNKHVLKSRSYYAFDDQQFLEWYSKPEKRNKFFYPIWLSKFRFVYRPLFVSRCITWLFGAVNFLFCLTKYVFRTGFNHNYDKVFRYWLKHFYKSLDEELLFRCYDSYDKLKQIKQDPIEVGSVLTNGHRPPRSLSAATILYS
jgi:hypothetical protein